MKSTLRERRPVAWFLGWLATIGGTLMILFWSLYFSNVIVFPESDGVIPSYESAFVLADLALTVLLVAAGFGLLTRRSWGVFCLVMAASIAVYLGLLDFTFYMNQGLYESLSVAAVMELVVNFLCVAGGSAALVLGWREWRRS